MTTTTQEPKTVARPPFLSAAALPKVNLLPPEIREASRLRVLQACLAAGVVASAAVVAAVAVPVQDSAEAAREDLVAAQAAHADVQGQVDGLGHVRDVYADAETADAAITAARASEVAWSRVLNDLSLLVPEGVWVESVSVSPGQGDDGTVATITYVGRGMSHDHVATWLEALAGQPGLTDPTFTTSAQASAGSEATVTFSSTARVTEEALASRPEEG